MQEKINAILSALTGLQLSRQTRAANIQCFQFGHLTIVNDKKAVGDFSLHLQSPWRLTDANEILVGSGDLYEPADQTKEYDPDFDWDKPNSNLRDAKLERLFSETQLSVISAHADNFGGLTIEFTHHVSLSVFPDTSCKTTHEYWRLIDHRHTKPMHYESWSTGYEIG